jgi:hypothetical protein
VLNSLQSERLGLTVGANGRRPLLPIAPVLQTGVGGSDCSAESESREGVVVETGEKPSDEREHCDSLSREREDGRVQLGRAARDLDCQCRCLREWKRTALPGRKRDGLGLTWVEHTESRDMRARATLETRSSDRQGDPDVRLSRCSGVVHIDLEREISRRGQDVDVLALIPLLPLTVSP